MEKLLKYSRAAEHFEEALPLGFTADAILKKFLSITIPFGQASREILL